MEEPNNKYWDLIAKHLQGEASGQEEADLSAWVDAKPENRHLFEKAKAAWKFTAEAEDTYIPDTENGWNQFRAKSGLAVHVQKEAAPEAKTIQFRPWTLLMRVAAILVVIVGLVYVVNQTKTDQSGTKQMLSFNAADEKKQVYLPDSSLVVLNKNSNLSYEADFNEKERVVYLTGEAFFDVRKTNGKTFTIFSSNAVTQVLGTSFTVRSYVDEGRTEVQVLTGKVAFSTKEDREENKVLLTPGFKAEVKSDEQIVKTQIDDLNFLAWKDNRLTFSNTRMDKVIRTLEKYFGVPIEVTDERMLACRFTGTFEQPTLQEIVDVLVVSVDLTYTRNYEQYIFSGRGCK
jgi:ferric-dicitrate binding protein FerR (iron transport regulator)